MQPPPPDAPTTAPPQIDPKAQTLAAASQVLPDVEFLHVVSMRPSEVCLVARDRPSSGNPEPSPFIVYLFRPVTDTGHLQHFRESAAKLMAVEHRSLGIPHKFGIAENHPYFFVDIPPGSSLTHLHESRQLHPSHVVRVIPEVCSALGTAHEAGVSHHSLTPDDIIIAPDGSVTILRLGFAEMLVRTPAERLAFVADTPPHLRHYLAPEQSDIEATNDPRTDIYAIGSILYELFTGRKIGGFFILPSSVSKLERRVDDLISIALQHSPDNRFPTAAEFGTYLTTVRSAEEAESEDERLSDSTAKDYFHTYTVTGTSPLKKIVGTIVALIAIAVGCFALYYNFVNDHGPDQALIDRLITMQELDGTTLSVPELAEKYAEVSEILGEVGPHKESLMLAIKVMQRLGDTEASKLVLEEYIAGLPPGTENLAELKAAQAEFGRNVDDYLVAMEEAAAARALGNDAAELAALQKALRFLPDDCHALKARRQNPIFLDREVGTALANARKQAPPSHPLSANYAVRRGAVDLDLSGNPSFFDLSPFLTLPIVTLDLSNTAVSDLTPLAGMPLKKIWLDDTPVTDLSPLAGAPLETLAFERAPVTDTSILESQELLTTVRYTSPSGQREFIIPTPTGEESWENDLGMRFVPLDIPGANILCSRWETRLMDFNEFASNAGTMLENAQAGAPAWDDDLAAQGKRHPVAAVSLMDAKAFCKWLTGHCQAAGFLPEHARFRLPTDYEWSVAAGLPEHPMLAPAARALQGAPQIASTLPGIRSVNRAAAADSDIHGLWENVREWTSSTIDEGTSSQFAVRGLHSVPEDSPDTAAHPPQKKGDLRTRHATHALEREYHTGFRIVLDLGAEHRPLASLPQLIAEGEREAAIKLAVDLARNSGARAIRDAARTYVELEEIETHFKRFRRVPPGLKNKVKYFQGRRYCLARLPLDWTTADKFTDAIGGHLVTIDSPAELDWVLENFTDPHDPSTIWVGATPSPANSSSWIWKSSSNSTNLPVSEKPIQPAVRLLLLPKDPPAPPSTTEAPATPDIWLQAPGHQRHFFLIEWG